jgi:histidine triad (HIT) family protein
MQADCTFCQIVSGELPADLVDEDERTVAFMDINPATLGHVLVVPRRHVADVMSAGAEDWLAVAATARRMARWVVAAFGAGGVDLMQANSDGSVGNQTVFHLHVHVLPRYHDDQLGSWWSPQTADPAEITEAARRLVDHGRRDPESTLGLASSRLS